MSKGSPKPTTPSGEGCLTAMRAGSCLRRSGNEIFGVHEEQGLAVARRHELAGSWVSCNDPSTATCQPRTCIACGVKASKENLTLQMETRLALVCLSWITTPAADASEEGEIAGR